MNAREFAENMRLSGDIRTADLADEILMALDSEPLVEQLESLIGDISHYVPDVLKEKPERAVEWLGDRSQELDEIRECFSEEAMAASSIPELIKELQEGRDDIETVMREHGGWVEGDLQDALFALIERASKIENDLEYDL